MSEKIRLIGHHPWPSNLFATSSCEAWASVPTYTKTGGDSLLDMIVRGTEGGHKVYHQGQSFILCLHQANEEAVAERIDKFIVKLKELKQVASPFTLVSTGGLQGL